ncbi:MAG: NAD-dependent epimerase/dehydratase family protein, partial [Planctomycetaceae bacterium]|nr:NAD-dependent epimerase/dehydratase family protein [Planctomycetaceae bacterium]
RGPRPLRNRRDRPPRGRLARRLYALQDRGRGSRTGISPGTWAARRIVRPGFIYGERDRTVLPKLLVNLRRGTFVYFGSGTQALNCIYVKNLVHGIFLAAQSPRASGEVFNLTDGEPVSKRRFVGRVAELAGIRPPSRHIPLGLARFLATIVEGAAKLRGAKNPPLINKARYKFLGLNLDYSIEKARTVLGYEPPYTFDEAIQRAMAEHRPRSFSEEPAAARANL